MGLCPSGGRPAGSPQRLEPAGEGNAGDALSLVVPERRGALVLLGHDRVADDAGQQQGAADGHRRDPAVAERGRAVPGGEVVLVAVLVGRRLALTENKRADAVQIAKRKETDLVHHGDARVGALHLLHRLGHGVEDHLIGVSIGIGLEFLVDVLGEDVEENLGIRVGLHHATAKTALEVVDVGEVSVVGNRYLASIAIHNQWLNILYVGSPGRRISGVSDRVVALEISQGVAFEYLRHQTHFAVRVE